MIDGTHETAIVAIVLSDSYRIPSNKKNDKDGKHDVPTERKQDKPADHDIDKHPFDFDDWDGGF